MKGMPSFKAYISSEGHLVIRRNGMWKKQYCYRNPSVRCGDWCPLFKDPTRYREKVSLKICKAKLTFLKEEFRDFRNHPEIEAKYIRKELR